MGFQVSNIVVILIPITGIRYMVLSTTEYLPYNATSLRDLLTDSLIIECEQ